MKKGELATRRKLDSKLTQEVTQIFEMLTCLEVALRPGADLRPDLRPDPRAAYNLVRKTETSFRSLLSLMGKALQQ